MGCNEGILRNKFIALGNYKEKMGRSKINQLRAHLKVLKQKEKNTPKRSRWQKINQTQNRK